MVVLINCVVMTGLYFRHCTVRLCTVTAFSHQSRTTLPHEKVECVQGPHWRIYCHPFVPLMVSLCHRRGLSQCFIVLPWRIHTLLTTLCSPFGIEKVLYRWFLGAHRCMNYVWHVGYRVCTYVGTWETFCSLLVLYLVSCHTGSAIVHFLSW